MLPAVKTWMGRAMVLSKQLQSFAPEIEKLSDLAIFNSGSPVGCVYVDRLVALQDCVARITETGCVVNSVDDGFVDFPHFREGREVYLSWRYDEADIGYWREVDADLEGRNPLDPPGFN